MLAQVVVVGGGFSGLAAARELHSRGIECVVVEARERVGGRIHNHHLPDELGGAALEIGGQWVGPGQDRVLALIDELGLETYDTHTTGANRFEHHGRVRSYRGEIPKLNPLALIDTQIALMRLERMARQVTLDAPWRTRNAVEWDAQSVASWTKRHMRTGLGRELVRLITEAVWAAEPEDVSLLHFLTYSRAGGSIERLISTEGGAQAMRVVGGSQLIALRIAEELGDAVMLGRPVRSIEHSAGSVRVVADGLEVEAERAIVALSPTLAGRIHYAPALPAHRDQLTQRTPMGTVIKCMAVYEEPWWRAEGFSGQATSTTGPAKVIFDNTPPEGTPGVLMGFLEGREARRLGRVPAEQRREAVIGSFARVFGDRAANPLHYFDRDWAAEEFTRGCYGAFFPTNTWVEFGEALRTPVGPIHWAGTEVAGEWIGYMDGALTAGEAAARAVAESLD